MTPAPGLPEIRARLERAVAREAMAATAATTGAPEAQAAQQARLPVDERVAQVDSVEQRETTTAMQAEPVRSESPVAQEATAVTPAVLEAKEQPTPLPRREPTAPWGVELVSWLTAIGEGSTEATVTMAIPATVAAAVAVAADRGASSAITARATEEEVVVVPAVVARSAQEA